ncbi:MAG: hypothetical protein JSV80_06720, partial [Acidobacteriota bacterium]
MRCDLRFTLGLLSTLALSVVAVALPGAANEEPANYAKNPGFEILWDLEDDGLLSLHGSIFEPTHWWPRHAVPTKQALYRLDLQTTHSGSCALSVYTRRQDPAVPLYEAWSSFVDARGLAGSIVTLRAMVRAESLDDSARVEFRIHAFRDDIAVGDPCGASSRTESCTMNWIEHTLTFEVPAAATDLMIQLGILGRGSVWFDEVALTIDNGAAPSETGWSADLADPRLIFVMDCGRVVREEAAPLVAPLATKPWNVLMYAAADFWTAFTPLEPFASQVHSNEDVNVLIFEDYIGLDAAIWQVERRGIGVHITPVQQLGQTDSDEPETLARFLEFAERWFPAERTLLYLYGHGHAWVGACNDQSRAPAKGAPLQQNWLTPPEMRAALEAVGGVDAVFFSAPCLMSSLEAAYELREVADLYVASEELSGYNLWREAVAPIAAALREAPNQDVAVLGRTAIDSLRDTVQVNLDSGDPSIPHQPVIAATVTSDLSEVAQAVDAFSTALINALPTHRAAILAARDAATAFVYGELVDVYSFAEACRGIPGLEESSTRVMRAIKRAVIAQVAAMALDGEAHGLSVYFPVLEPDMPAAGLTLSFDRMGATYRTYGLSFVADTSWPLFLRAFFAP